MLLNKQTRYMSPEEKAAAAAHTDAIEAAALANARKAKTIRPSEMTPYQRKFNNDRVKVRGAWKLAKEWRGGHVIPYCKDDKAFRIFSNLAECPFPLIPTKGAAKIHCRSAEHAYVYLKLGVFLRDPHGAQAYRKIEQAENLRGRLDTLYPLEVKQEAKKVIPREWNDKFRDSGDARRFLGQAMEAKFKGNRDACRMLLATSYAYLVEATFDEYWGAGIKLDRMSNISLERLSDPRNHPGRNAQGLILMRIREQLREDKSWKEALPKDLEPIPEFTSLPVIIPERYRMRAFENTAPFPRDLPPEPVPSHIINQPYRKRKSNENKAGSEQPSKRSRSPEATRKEAEVIDLTSPKKDSASTSKTSRPQRSGPNARPRTGPNNKNLAPRPPFLPHSAPPRQVLPFPLYTPRARSAQFAGPRIPVGPLHPQAVHFRPQDVCRVYRPNPNGYSCKL